ncbi:hypothetical protein FOFC_09828 [Fusarium oxysporum]|nr:hypothetical protein FOFC_09828 [Fusarium oxysporum]
MLYPYLLVATEKADAAGKQLGANHTVDTCKNVRNWYSNHHQRGGMAPNNCTFRVVTGRVENKKNKTKAQNRQAEKLADKTTDKQLKFGIS